jgi:Big-like domain-containing protein
VRTLPSLAAALLLPLLASCGDVPTQQQVQVPTGGVRKSASFWISCPASLPVGGQGRCSVYTFNGGAYPTSWYSSNPAVVSVSSIGVLLARTPGSATITAYGGGYTSSSGVSVYSTAPAVVTSVTVSSATVYPGSTAQLTAKVYDQYGNQMTGKTVTWSIDNPAVATISASGVVTGVSIGSTTARAAVDGVSGAGTVTVSAYQDPVDPTYPTCPNCQIP